MEKYLGKEVLDNLSPDFSTTDSNSTIIFKISIMNAFKKYFKYKMHGLSVCGIIRDWNLSNYFPSSPIFFFK